MPIADDSDTSRTTGRAKMTRSEAARHAALVRYGKEQPFGRAPGMSYRDRLAQVRAQRAAGKKKAKAGGKGKAAAKPKGARAKDPEAEALRAKHEAEREQDRQARLQRQATRDAEHQQDRTARQQRQAQQDAERTARQADREKAQAQREQERKQAQKEKAKSGAASDKERAARQSEHDAQVSERAARAQRIQERVQSLALGRALAGGTLSDRQRAEMEDAGLVDRTSGTLTEAGARLTGGKPGAPIGAPNEPEDAPAPDRAPTAQELRDAEQAGAQAAQTGRRASKRHQRRRQSTIANLTATVDEGKSMRDWLETHRTARHEGAG